MDKVFTHEAEEIEFDAFKKAFFPYLCQIEDTTDLD